MNAIAQPTATLTHRSLEKLEEDLVSLARHINATEYEFLVLLREFDLRRGWKAYHFNHCAEWLNMKCGMSPRTAREKLRVANALFDLPAISLAFQKGDLSYSKARALSRVATPRNEGELLDFALKANAAHVDRHCFELRNVQRHSSTADANRAHKHRYLSYTPNPDGTISINAELPKEQADLVIKALERAFAELDSADDDFIADGCSAEEVSEIDDNGSREPSAHQQKQADALVELCRSYLAGGEQQRSCTADHYQVTVHVDEKSLSGSPDESSRSDLPIETVRRLCCDGAVVPLVHENGTPTGIGRKHRVVNPALKRALLARDQGCRFPGCTHTKWLDAHHVKHWAEGGETRMENLVMLCPTHHRLVHEGGFEIKRGPDGDWQFRAFREKFTGQSNVGRVLPPNR